MQNKKNLLFIIVGALILFLGAGYFYKSSESKEYEKLSQEQAQLFQKPNSYVVGKEDAKVQLVEFFDPACETCAQFHFMLKKFIKDKGNDEIKLVLRYAPYHQNSNYAVMMLEGAREQGLFMQTLDFMFESQGMWTVNHVVDPDKLWYLLQNVEGLDMEKLADFMNSKKADAIIEQDLADAKTLKADKTPSYFVNGKPLQQFGYENLINLIKSELEK